MKLGEICLQVKKNFIWIKTSTACLVRDVIRRRQEFDDWGEEPKAKFETRRVNKDMQINLV